jgi:hypothetical protein
LVQLSPGSFEPKPIYIHEHTLTVPTPILKTEEAYTFKTSAIVLNPHVAKTKEQNQYCIV